MSSVWSVPLPDAGSRRLRVLSQLWAASSLQWPYPQLTKIAPATWEPLGESCDLRPALYAGWDWPGCPYPVGHWSLLVRTTEDNDLHTLRWTGPPGHPWTVPISAPPPGYTVTISPGAASSVTESPLQCLSCLANSLLWRRPGGG